MKKLLKLIDELEAKIPFSNKLQHDISRSNVGWHIEHSLLTIRQIIKGLEISDPALYKWKFNFPRAAVYLIKTIPRGRGKAPKIVQPEGEINHEVHKTHFKSIRSKVEILNKLDQNNFIEHPYFGQLNLKPTIVFLEIHTKHHLKIINDILK